MLIDEKDLDFVEYDEEGGHASFYRALAWEDGRKRVLGEVEAGTDKDAREKAKEKFAGENLSVLEALDEQGGLLRYVSVKPFFYTYIPEAEFSMGLFEEIRDFALKKGIRAAYAQLDGGVAFQIWVGSLHKLPKDQFGPYLGVGGGKGFPLSDEFFMMTEKVFWVPVKNKALKNQAVDHELGIEDDDTVVELSEEAEQLMDELRKSLEGDSL